MRQMMIYTYDAGMTHGALAPMRHMRTGVIGGDAGATRGGGND
jgi:hypothetical protein